MGDYISAHHLHCLHSYYGKTYYVVLVHLVYNGHMYVVWAVYDVEMCALWAVFDDDTLSLWPVLRAAT